MRYALCNIYVQENTRVEGHVSETEQRSGHLMLPSACFTSLLMQIKEKLK